jgi:hypothetical protein
MNVRRIAGNEHAVAAVGIREPHADAKDRLTSAGPTVLVFVGRRSLATDWSWGSCGPGSSD